MTVFACIAFVATPLICHCIGAELLTVAVSGIAAITGVIATISIAITSGIFKGTKAQIQNTSIDEDHTYVLKGERVDAPMNLDGQIKWYSMPSEMTREKFTNAVGYQTQDQMYIPQKKQKPGIHYPSKRTNDDAIEIKENDNSILQDGGFPFTIPQSRTNISTSIIQQLEISLKNIPQNLLSTIPDHVNFEKIINCFGTSDYLHDFNRFRYVIHGRKAVYAWLRVFEKDDSAVTREFYGKFPEGTQYELITFDVKNFPTLAFSLWQISSSFSLALPMN
ncbi:MAG: hypothetical protein LBI69_01685 [Puniceicoccales bacterium]|nr:hypothetical protein [Puniceicoccales bacterium]